MARPHLTKAKDVKNDEFYTLYQDIEKEVNAYMEYNPDVFKEFYESMHHNPIHVISGRKESISCPGNCH